MACADQIHTLKQGNGRYQVEITVDGERGYARGCLDATAQPPNPTDAHNASTIEY